MPATRNGKPVSRIAPHVGPVNPVPVRQADKPEVYSPPSTTHNPSRANLSPAAAGDDPETETENTANSGKKPPETPSSPDENGSALETPESGKQHPNNRPLNILLVDDQRENLLALEAILRDTGYHLIRADSGENALRHILRHDVALVLLDVRMPGLDGFETARLIRKRERSHAIPIIFLTAAGRSDEMIYEGYLAGAVDYIVKPFVPEILRAKVKVFLDLAAARRELEEEVERRRQAEWNLQEIADRLSLAVEGASLGTWHWNLDSGEMLWSQRGRTLLGLPETGAVDYDRFLNCLHQEDRKRVAQLVKKASQKGGEFDTQYRIVHPGSTVRWLASRGRAYPRQEGKPARMEGVVYDITAEKEAEAQIHQLNETLRARAAELENANQELEAFAYSASHDLRGPLRHIRSFAHMIIDSAGPGLSGEPREMLDRLADSAARMDRLLDDLLTFSRVGREELRSVPCDLDSLVDEALHELKNDAHQPIQWKRSRLPEVRGDPAMLRQVFINLLSNSLKYTRDSDPAVIEIGCERKETEVIVFVRDNGAGFKMEHAKKLFQVFQRLHGDSEYEGSGIGLANVARIIHRHDGKVWAEGVPNEGATFYFTLPTPQAK